MGKVTSYTHHGSTYQEREQPPHCCEQRLHKSSTFSTSMPHTPHQVEGGFNPIFVAPSHDSPSNVQGRTQLSLFTEIGTMRMGW